MVNHFLRLYKKNPSLGYDYYSELRAKTRLSNLAIEQRESRLEKIIANSAKGIDSTHFKMEDEVIQEDMQAVLRKLGTVTM